MWRATVLTLFPEIFPGPLGCSLAGEALTRGVWSLETKQIRDHGLGRHHTVDDAPMGGGPGMVMRVDVLAAALDSLSTPDDARPRLLMSPRGRPLTQARRRRNSGAYVDGCMCAFIAWRYGRDGVWRRGKF
jgi:tRNA (guanine37-N1)-methyltransferase